MYLGNHVEQALSLLGVTRDRVESWLGAPCGCEERKARLNALDQHARRVLSGRVRHAREYLGRLLSED